MPTSPTVLVLREWLLEMVFVRRTVNLSVPMLGAMHGRRMVLNKAQVKRQTLPYAIERSGRRVRLVQECPYPGVPVRVEARARSECAD